MKSNKLLTKRYTLSEFYNDVIRQFKEEEVVSDKDFRDVKYLLKVLVCFIAFVQEVENNDEYDVEMVIKNKLDNDSSLFAYTFYLSLHSQFDYSWSYLRKQWDEYAKTLNSACKFILDMIDKVNVLCEHQSDFIANEFVFADIFVLSFDKETRLPYLKTKWENINNLFDIRNGYHISAKIGDEIQMTMEFRLNKTNNMDSFLSHLVNWKRNASVRDHEKNK